MTVELSRADKVRVAAAGAFGVLVAVTALTAVVQIVGGAGVPTILPLAQTLPAKAAAATQPAQAQRLIERGLSLQPANAAFWLALAKIEADRNGAMDPKATGLLDRSYLVGPYDPRVLTDRIVFAFDHWGALSADLKRQVLSEVDAAWSVPTEQARLPGAGDAMHDPEGRLAYWNALFGLHIADISAWVEQHGPVHRSLAAPPPAGTAAAPAQPPP